MKRNLAIFTALIAFLFVLTGCSKTPANTQNNNQSGQPGGQQGNQANKSGQEQNFGRSRQRMPDFGQPDKRADVRGVVKSIIGNEVTVIKIDMANGRASSSPDKASGASSTDASSKPAVSLTTGSGASRGGMGGGRGAGGQGGFGGGQSTTSRADMLAKLKAMSSGEEQITIPVGIKMLKPDTESGTGTQPKMVEATLADVTTDKMLTIWLNASSTDKKIAEFILIN
jgi:hypothetical protein